MLQISNATDLGKLLREQRRLQRLRQDDLAEGLRTSHVFLRKLERGEAAQVNRLFAVLADLGITLYVKTPPLADGPDR